jgi:S1-C subfamily serine protease
MRIWVLTILLVLLASPVVAQDKVVQTFDGTTAITTPAFQAQDRWEVRYDSPGILSITVLAADGSVAAGASGTVKGSLYLPKGGSYTLQVSPGSNGGNSPWHITIVQVGPGVASDDASNYVPPVTAAPPPSTALASTPVAPTPSPPATPAPTATPTNPPASGLTEDQARAVVVIKGDYMEGTGFLVHTADGPAVVTNLHVISANPNVKILTTTGAEVKIVSLKGASDRDLAMFMIQDDHYSYLDLATDIKDTVQAGDEVITPGNSEGGEVVLNTKGKVLGIGPERIEFDNPIYHGNSGGPVFHINSGKVLAVVTQAMKVNTSNDLDKASFDNKNSAITGTMRYFGLRLDTVPKWEPYDWNRFLTETTFLKNFHDQSRCLDSFMNGASYERAHVASEGDDGPPTAQYWMRNDKLQTVHDNFHKLATDSDQSQKLDAVREEVIDLDGLADRDMPAIQNPGNFYSFDAIRAAQEIKYRKALRTEIDNYGDKISDMGH